MTKFTEILEMFGEGNLKYLKGQLACPQQSPEKRPKDNPVQQTPATLIACVDTRVAPEKEYDNV